MFEEFGVKYGGPSEDTGESAVEDGFLLGLLVLEHGPADAGQGDDRASDLIDLIEADHALGDEETAGGAEAVADE